jgi:Chalcone isomerase-like
MRTLGIVRKLLLLGVGALTALALNGSNASAAEISGVKLPDQVSVAGKSLKLNGAGLRQATILKINVYAAGLYLENSSNDGEAIANSNQIKSIEMVFMRDVSGKQMAEAFQEGFEKNCVAGCADLKGDLSKLQGLMKDMKKGDSMAFHFLADGVAVMIRGQKVGSVGDKAFSHQLIRCWIGKNPPNAELKEGFLSGKK